MVAGDVMLDLNITIERDVTVASRAWREAGKVRRLEQHGGAWLLAELIQLFAANTPYAGKVHGVEKPGAAGANTVHQTYTVLARARDEVWRVGEFLGVENVADGKLRLVWDDPAAEVVVLLDSDLGFDRTPESDWPAAIKNPDHHPWIVFKTAAPAFEGLLWRHLIKCHRDKLIVVMTVDDLRRREIQLLRRLSWERAAQDLLSEMRNSDALRALSDCRHVIVSFGTAGAMHAARGDTPRLVFDPSRMEGEWEPDKKDHGIMIGYTTVLAAAVTHEVLTQPESPQLADAAARGIAGMRALFTNGYGKASEPQILTAPIVKAALDPDADKIVSSGEITDLETRTWTILEDRLRNSAKTAPDNDATDALYELAARVAVFGPKAALADAPQLNIGKLFSVDREEIESLRSIKGLLAEYVQRKPSKPFSIAVFGSPGSGKSFAVEEIASNVGGNRIQTLTFNLTQFTRSQDLHGAFHQIRDVSLSGLIPVVFWDEFDTTYADQPLGWLRYFIGPMQDGKFQEDQITHPIGTSIFVFGGGTASTKEEFVTPPAGREQSLNDEKRKALKVPDFISRLKGFLDVTGPNRRESHDPHYLIRRAVLLRSMIEKHCPDLFQKEGDRKILQIDPGVLHAFLTTQKYRHGARSLESIIAMSALAGRKHFDNSSLPPEPQLELHVELPFEQLAQRLKFTYDVALLEQLAEMAHETFRNTKKEQRWQGSAKRDDGAKHHDLLDKSYAQLRETDKERNRITIRWIPAKIATEGYDMAPAGSAEPRSLQPEEIERLAKLEHAIWMRGKKAAGYEWGAKASESPKRSPYLVEWEDLEPQFQEVDRKMIEAIPKILERAHYILVKKTDLLGMGKQTAVEEPVTDEPAT